MSRIQPPKERRALIATSPGPSKHCINLIDAEMKASTQPRARLSDRPDHECS